MSELSLLGFIAHIGVMHAEVRHMEHHALEVACRIIHAEAQRVIGSYDYGWDQLAPSTQSQRVQMGFPANEPLLRTGELRDSIEWTVVAGDVNHGVGYVGSNNPKAVWNFLGTSRIPARDPILGAVMHTRHEVEEAIGHRLVAWLGGRGRAPIARIL